MNPLCDRCGVTAKVMGIASITLCKDCHKDASGVKLYMMVREAVQWRIQRDEARTALVDCLRLLRDMPISSLTAEQRKWLGVACQSAKRALAKMDTEPEPGE